MSVWLEEELQSIVLGARVESSQLSERKRGICSAPRNTQAQSETRSLEPAEKEQKTRSDGDVLIRSEALGLVREV